MEELFGNRQELLIFKKINCIYCGEENLIRKGYSASKDKRPRLYCPSCKRKFTVAKRKPGAETLNLSRLLPIHLKPNSELSNVELYSLGFIIADGSLSNTNQLSITIQVQDDAILNIIRTALQIENKVKRVNCQYPFNDEIIVKEYARLTWGYQFSEEFWAKFGLFKGKTGNEIWLSYMANNHFLRGLWDGDGGFSIADNNLRGYLTSSSERFIKAVQNHLYSIINNKGSLGFTRGAYNLCYFGNNAIALGNYLYQDSKEVYLERKYTKYLEIKQRFHINKDTPNL